MKKLFTLLSLILILTAANAQRTCNLQVTAVDPTGTVTAGVPFDVTCKIKNLGPDTVIIEDTLLVFVQINTSLTSLYTGYYTTLNPGEEKPYVAKNGVLLTGNPGTYQICNFVVLQDRGTNKVTTVNKSACNSVNYVYKTGIAVNPDAIVVEGIDAYPNPAINETKVTYTVKQNSDVHISVKDVTGREILVVVNENQSTGVYEKQLDITSLKSGVYFLEYVVDGKVLTSKLVKN